MNLIFADPALRGRADSSIAWYHYLVPELQIYWIAPLLFAHAECDSRVETPLIRSEHGQEIPKPLPITRLFRHDPWTFMKQGEGINDAANFETLAQQCEEDFLRLPACGRGDCLYLKDAGMVHVRAAVRWLRRYAAAERPRAIVHVADGQAGEITDALGVGLRAELHKDLRSHLKLVGANARTASYFESLFDYEVECWPNPQFSKMTRSTRAQGRLIAVLGNQTEEKGKGILPELASLLLDRHPDAALLVHNALGQGRFCEGLRAIEQRNKRLVVMQEVVPFERWKSILSAADLAILPYDRGAFRDRSCWLLDEVIAHGVPALVPLNSELETRVGSFGIADQSFDEATPGNICEAAGRMFANWPAVSKAAQIAQDKWNETQGAQRLAANILSWFPEQRPKWSGWRSDERSGVAARPETFPKATHRTKRVLLSWSVDPSYIPPPILSDYQVTVGPHPLGTRNTLVRPNQKRPFDAYTPFFHTYDLPQVLAAQGIHGPFDLVVVATESTFGNVPLNAGGFGCPTVLYAGDTHWGSTAITRMVEYSVAGGFDYVATTYNRQHLHWYAEAGKRKLAWIPGLAVEHLPHPIRNEKIKQIGFAGLTQQTHARRARLLANLQRAGLPIKPQSLSRTDAALLYNSTSATFNCSLNGDLNLRHFEVLSAGGCLVTDRLAPESGQGVLFEEGRDYLGYSSEEELIETLRRCLADPAFAARIARAGHESYVGKFLPEHQSDTLLDWVLSAELKEEYGFGWDRRPELAAVDGLPLETRITIYEQLQESHRLKETVRALVCADVPLGIVGDMLDLPRLSCHVLGSRDSVEPVLARYCLGGRVSYVDTWERAKALGRWDFVIAVRGAERPAKAVSCERTIEVERPGVLREAGLVSNASLT